MWTLALLFSCTPEQAERDSSLTDSQPAGGEDSQRDPVRDIQTSSLPQAADACREPELVEVRYVHDGDTLFVAAEGSSSEEKIRLIGLDAPEIDYEDSQGECFGDESASWLRDAVEGKLAWLTFDQRCEDDYGRTLAYLHRDVSSVDDFINYSSLRQGAAAFYPWSDGLTNSFDALFAEAEAAAQGDSLGIWGECSG